MIRKQVPAWLFVLASHDDRRIKYYGCLCYATIASGKEIERSVLECDTMTMVSSFLKSAKPDDIARLDDKYRYKQFGGRSNWCNFVDSIFIFLIWLYAHVCSKVLKNSLVLLKRKKNLHFRSGRSRQYLAALAPLLYCHISEVCAMAMFQLAMEAVVRKGNAKIHVKIFFLLHFFLTRLPLKRRRQRKIVFSNRVLLFRH